VNRAAVQACPRTFTKAFRIWCAEPDDTHADMSAVGVIVFRDISGREVGTEDPAAARDRLYLQRRAGGFPLAVWV